MCGLLWLAPHTLYGCKELDLMSHTAHTMSRLDMLLHEAVLKVWYIC